MVKQGRFCFNHPVTFNKWEDKGSAQYDKWDSHSAYEVTHVVIAPLLRDDPDGIEYGEPIKLTDRAILHEQSSVVKQTPICCFRMVTENEVVFHRKSMSYSLGDIADRIHQEFGHDSYVMIQAVPFLERMKRHGVQISGGVIYSDLLNEQEIDVPRDQRDFVDQLFRKDKKYEWQKEYRLALSPSTNNPVFLEIGSIEDIAFWGKLSDLRD